MVHNVGLEVWLKGTSLKSKHFLQNPLLFINYIYFIYILYYILYIYYIYFINYKYIKFFYNKKILLGQFRCLDASSV
jgi:polyferredoxin